MNNLPTVLIRFREGVIAVTADIEAMFSRIQMKRENARYHRFLWRPPGSGDIITYQMDRVTFSNYSSPRYKVSCGGLR